MRKDKNFITKENKPLINNDDLRLYSEIRRKEIASPYIRLKLLQLEIDELFNFEVEVVKSSFTNENNSFFLHRNCGNLFSMPLEKLKQVGPRDYCPYCHELKHLSQLGSIRAIQDFVWEKASLAAGFCEDNRIGKLDEHYDFRCAIHDCVYPATFQQFLNNAPGTNSCPLCEIDRKDFRQITP